MPLEFLRDNLTLKAPLIPTPCPSHPLSSPHPQHGAETWWWQRLHPNSSLEIFSRPGTRGREKANSSHRFGLETCFWRGEKRKILYFSDEKHNVLALLVLGKWTQTGPGIQSSFSTDEVEFKSLF